MPRKKVLEMVALKKKMEWAKERIILMKGHVIGIDLGGTLIKAAAFDSRGRLLTRTQTDTLVREGKERVATDVVALVTRMARESESPPLLALGVGVPGLLDYKKGVVIKCPNLPGWEKFPLKGYLEERLKKPVILENDANAGALGEKWLGAARGMRNFMLVTLGTGVGSGLVLNGRLWRGEVGQAGELGHLKVKAQGLPCGCGDRGCLEVYASGSAVRRMAREALAKGRRTILHQMVGGKLERLDPALVQQAAAQGDQLARGIYRILGAHLGLALAQVVNILDVTNFILGGGVSKAWNLFLPSLKRNLYTRVIGREPATIKILPAECGEDAGIVGLAYLALAALREEGKAPAKD